MTRPSGLSEVATHETKTRLLDAGLELFLARGYGGTGIQELLDATGIPRGSFYHHFENKEDFALQVIDRYAAMVHEALDAALSDRRRTPLNRIRGFFGGVREAYASEGYLGCLLGALGQELAATNRIFQIKIESCIQAIALRLSSCLEEARQRGELGSRTDPRQLADIIVNCWEGAALRSRLLRDPAPLDAVLDFCMSAVRPPG
jgi:TetR/AcrR family transcriptional repressor of nem operon